ncbi:MAG: hypothetical protein ACSHWW_07045 [Nonlabens sp.]|uniref:hypothetical protein n=1 Tax=Nonlabens sp. TaxID=1888209 RepID=UPI003EF35E89
MKKLSTLLIVFLIGIGMSYANTTEDNRYRGYTNSFIFNEGGIEFAIFPDGQFDFNYLNDGPQFGTTINTRNISVTFNTGYNYDAYVQYDSYGAVIQIENTPIYYDGYGRIIQAGDVFINYRNGYVNRVGNLNVYYNRPGIILRTSGYINRFNRTYIYQPWHGYYGVPLVSNCIVWNNPYRVYYNPYRYDWSYHRVNWNRPNYYNGCYAQANVRRTFYRPNDRVNYRSFERGRRGSNGRAIATREANRDREAITRGRRTITRSDSGLASNGRRSESVNSTNRRSNTTVGSRNSNRISDSSTRTSRSSRATNSNEYATSRRTSNSSPAISSRTNRRSSTATIPNSRSSRTTTPAISNTRTSRRSSANVDSTSRTTRRSTPAVSNSRTSRRSTGNVSSSSRNSRTSTATSRGSSSRSTSRATTPSTSRKKSTSTKRTSSRRSSGRS